MRIGLDFGTTNTSAAVVIDGAPQVLPLDPASLTPEILRSALFLTRPDATSGGASVPYLGREAIDRFTHANVGRVIDYQLKFIGTTDILLGDLPSISQAMYSEVDMNAPGRLFQSLKTEMRSRAYEGTSVFGVRYSIEMLVGTLLREIAGRIERLTGEPITAITIGRPVRYSEDAGENDLAFERMRAACAFAGLPDAQFLEEPSAAALAYLRDSARAETVMVFDFGGGTFDVTLLRADGAGKARTLATAGVPVGGELFDQRLTLGRLLDHFGQGATMQTVMGGPRMPVPNHILRMLGDWETIVELSRREHMETIELMVSTGDRPIQLRALRDLVRHNFGLPFYEKVEQAKVALSAAERARFRMEMGDIFISDTIRRIEFERLIGPDARRVDACMDEALAKAGLRATDVDVVLRTGGSSRIPLFQRLLAAKFGESRLREIDAFTSVAAGLAIAAAQPGE